ncbi:hypothetical protein LCGC14_1783360 [marine sediment metagenome]|uniref:Uncharacterized protein n=1 Tax=marine sediment metagenome TaxID=412755 RepID=A0A0F9J9M0_9ZZZZ
MAAFTSTAYCSWCGRNCSCSSGVFTISVGHSRSSREIREAAEQRKLKEELRRWAFRQHSLEMSRDYSPVPAPRPMVHSGIPSTAFHWMGHRKRAYKMRASKPGWDRGR